MILNGKNELGLAFDRFMQDELFNLHYSKYIESVEDLESKALSILQIKSLFENKDNHNYIFKNTALDIASKIKLDKGAYEDFSFITDKLPKKKCTYLMGRHKFYRWIRFTDTSDVLVICVKMTEPEKEHEKDINEMRNFFSGMNENEIKRIITEQRKSGALNEYEYQYALSALENKNFQDQYTRGYFYYMWAIRDGKLNFPENERNEDFFNEMMCFIKLLTFTELSELEISLIKPNQSVGNKKDGKYLNQSNSNVSVVDSTWNKIIVRSGAFGVSGHLRLQPTSNGKKLIYIKEYTKTGYTRNASKEIFNNSKNF